MSDIKHYLIINSTPEKIYKALTTKEGVAGWWTTQNIIGNKINDKNIFDFGERYHNEMRVSDLQLHKKVEWHLEIVDNEWIQKK